MLKYWGLEDIGDRLITYEKHPALPVDEITGKSKKIKRFDGVIRSNPLQRKK